MKLSTKKVQWMIREKKKSELTNHQIAYYECVSQMDSKDPVRHIYVKVGRESPQTHERLNEMPGRRQH